MPLFINKKGKTLEAQLEESARLEKAIRENLGLIGYGHH